MDEEPLIDFNAKVISACEEGLLDNFQSDEDWIKFTLNFISKYNIIPPENIGEQKDAEQSEKFREDGNRLFISAKSPLTKDKYIDVLELYTKSIAYAPCQSQQLALGYANRSAILIKLHKYESCIQDIEKALALPCPDNVCAKLCVRKVECLNALGDPKVEDSIEEARDVLEQLCLDDIVTKKFIEKLDSMEMTTIIIKKQDEPQQLLLPKIDNINPEVPCASDAVTIKYNKEYGRHIVATRDIRPGEVISVEEPYSLILPFERIYSNCSYCLELSWASIPCDYCTSAMYCSEDCKITNWKKYHDIECAIFPFLSKIKSNFIDIFSGSLRLTVQAVREFASIKELRKELTEVDHCNDPRIKGFSKSGILNSDKYRSVLGLSTNNERRSKQQRLLTSLDSSFILYYLATRTDFFGSPLEKDLLALANNNDAVFIGSLVLRHQQQMRTNANALFTDCELGEWVKCAVGILAFSSLLNHSCNPNLMKVYKSKHVSLYAKDPIKEGEQLFDCYGPNCRIMPKAERQRKLLEKFHFRCNCPPCQEEQIREI